MSADKIQNDPVGDAKRKTSEYIESLLLKFDETNSVSPGEDVNNKITSLDVGLEQLRAELVIINNSVEQGLDRLGDTDTDLTAKVSETYKRLGEIDNAYKSLMAISSRIDTDIQKLNGDVSMMAEESASGIKNLEHSNIAHTNAFTEKHLQVSSRLNRLVETSKLTGELLDQKIQSATSNILRIEKNLIAEIETLSGAGKKKAGFLENSIAGNAAKILKLQAVDEAIIRRATTLEISSAELTVKSQQLEASTEQLKNSTESLVAGLSHLQERTLTLEQVTRSLERISSDHGSKIEGLHKENAELTGRLAALADIDQKRLNVFTAGFLLLLAVPAVIYLVQQNQFDLSDEKFVIQNDKIDYQVVSLQQRQIDLAADTKNLLAALESKIAKVDHTMQNVQDQVQSVEGRMNLSTQPSRPGNDNIIHGAHWIAALPQENYTVQLAYVKQKDVLYEVAKRYKSYLQDSLSYFEVYENGVTGYVLLSGDFATQQQARAAIRTMPRYVGKQQPIIRKLEKVQKYIAE